MRYIHTHAHTLTHLFIEAVWTNYARDLILKDQGLPKKKPNS